MEEYSQYGVRTYDGVDGVFIIVPDIYRNKTYFTGNYQRMLIRVDNSPWMQIYGDIICFEGGGLTTWSEEGRGSGNRPKCPECGWDCKNNNTHCTVCGSLETLTYVDGVELIAQDGKRGNKNIIS
mgnify:CR=1 FL=1